MEGARRTFRRDGIRREAMLKQIQLGIGFNVPVFQHRYNLLIRCIALHHAILEHGTDQIHHDGKGTFLNFVRQ